MEKQLFKHKTWVPRNKHANSNIQGAQFIPDRQFQIYFLAKTNTGKSVQIANLILKKAIPKYTKVIGFVPTHENDETYIQMKKLLKRKKIEYSFKHGFIEDGENMLKEFIEQLQKKKESPDEHDPNEQQQYQDVMESILANNPHAFCNFGPSRKRKKKKKEDEEEDKDPRGTKYILVFDDLGSSRQEGLRNPTIDHLLKSARHIDCSVILSSQHEVDISPSSFQQIRYACLFGDIPSERLGSIRRKMALELKDEHFEAIYRYATQEPHSFLYVQNRPKLSMRRNWNNLLDHKKIIAYLNKANTS